MLTNSQIKHIVSLKQKKFRTEHQQFVVEGVKVVKELLGLGPIWCRTVTGQAVSMDSVIEDIYNEVMGNK